MKKMFTLLTIILLLLSGCGKSQEEGKKSDGNKEEQPAMLTAELQLPNEAKANEPVKIGVMVKKGDQFVDDASEVLFEMRDKEGTYKERQEGVLEKDGFYKVEHTFPKGGTYEVSAHVTASNMHAMPEKNLVVHEGKEESLENVEEEQSEQHTHSHHHSHIEIELLSSNNVKAGENEVSVLVKNEGKALMNGSVQFEVWTKAAKKHEYIQAKETDAGTYVGTIPFKEANTYFVQVHVVKGDLHDHKHLEFYVTNQ